MQNNREGELEVSFRALQTIPSYYFVIRLLTLINLQTLWNLVDFDVAVDFVDEN